ncbi:MAG TPA: phosphoribosyltransferase [Blastocatellia bacterium]|jgi:putative phosphoribosyl transferase|nr:phosphoribosyltransferase [Blastocatellia bacterium]
MRFKNRVEAGRSLAERLSAYANRRDALVLGLPRGGVPVAYEVATALNVPMDVFVVRKLGVPGHEELAMGAIATGGARSLNQDVIEYLRIPEEVVDEVTEKEEQELGRRERLYRDNRPARSPRDRVAILVDDGLATGSSMRAAALALRQQQPASIVVAIPVASVEACESLGGQADEVVCLYTPEPFYAVGLWYEDFSQTTDEEVRDLLARAENKLTRAART